MIDFRYHLVSIIAVFLALAIGLVVGANELQGTTEAALNRAAIRVTHQNSQLTQQNRILQRQVGADQAFAQAADGRLLGGLLTGQTVVLVTAPGADDKVVSGVGDAVRRAGGKVTGQVALGSQFFDGSGGTEAKLNQLAESLAPAAGVTLSGQASSDSIGGQEEAAQVLAAAIVSKGGPALAPAQRQQILDGFGQSSYLQVSNLAKGTSGTPDPATMAIVVPPSSAPAGNGSSSANPALIAVADQLAQASHGAVLAGSLPGSGPGSVIADASGDSKVSTVDNANTAVGQVVTVQALWELAAGHPPASYGVSPGAVPSPAPTPSADPTSSTVVHHPGKK